MTNTNASEQAVSVADDERLLTRRLLRKLVPVSDMTIWRWEQAGKFPRHLTIYGRNYWLHSEVAEWMARQQRSQGQPLDEAAD